MNKIFKYLGVIVVVMILTLSFNTQPATAVVSESNPGDPPRCAWSTRCYACDIIYSNTTTCVGVSNCHCSQ
jgi:hypothetical protein